ncbi:MAG TPA: TRAP transporter small permease [Paenirhodobacter sp.]
MLSKFLRQIVGLIGLVTMLLYFYQIVSTWLFHAYSIYWFAEVAVYALTWAMFVASADLVKIDGHIRADFCVSRFSNPTQRWCEVFNCTVGLCFGLLMLWYGWQLAYDAWDWDERSPTGLAFPLWIYYTAAPISGALLTYRYIERLWLYLTAYDPQSMALTSNEVM